MLRSGERERICIVNNDERIKQQPTVGRREFLTRMGVGIGAAAMGAAIGSAAPSLVNAAAPPAKVKGAIPDTPYKTAHMTFLTGPLTVMAEPSIKGHMLAAEEINAEGGLLGKRKIVTLKADEAAGVDSNVKEMRRLKLQENIDLFTGIISSGNTPALGPVAEELQLLTIFADGCTDFLFDKVVTQPKYIFRISAIQSADGVACAVGTATAWPEVRKFAHIHPDYSYGRNAFDHFSVAIEKLLPGSEIVSQAWPKLGTTDFTPHITKAIASGADCLVTSCWGGDYIVLYKQGLRYGLFDKMKVATCQGFSNVPHTIGKDHPEGVLMGVHANYFFTNPNGNGRWPANEKFVKAYYQRWNEFPPMEAEVGYTTLYLLKLAVEKANKLVGGWPDDEAIISQLEGLGWDSPAGYIQIRPDNHQGYKDAVTGFSKNVAEFPFPIWDPQKIITIPIRNITAPANWPKPGTSHNDVTSAYNWIKTTWPTANG
jgi:branched-chain amino acid transport system substrate-binding protein